MKRCALVSSAFFLAACSTGLEVPLMVVSPQDASESIQLFEQQGRHDQIDLLFVVDDSMSMSAKQEELKRRFPKLIEELDAFGQAGNPASYHIGVITSDLGAPGTTCGNNLGAKLQQRGLAVTNDPTCNGPVGVPYIDYDQRTGANNLPDGQDLPSTFDCMATVVDPDDTPDGHYGCGYEMPLEAVYRALHDDIPENAGFLRPNALLAVVFVTDEDDCSADPSSTLFGADAQVGARSYRCAQLAISCDGMPTLPFTPQASYGNCVPATNAYLTHVDKYVDFFTKPASQGGVKANPRDVFLAAIAAPDSPIGTMTVTDASACGSNQPCTQIGHSCASAADPSFFGDPAVRLDYVLRKAKNNEITSICDDDYTPALEQIGRRVAATPQPSCPTSPLAGGAEHPQCTVEDLIDGAGGAIDKSPIPHCDAGAMPCWHTTTLPTCPEICNPTSGQYEQVGIVIERGAVAAAPGAYVQISCATVPSATDSLATCGAP